MRRARGLKRLRRPLAMPILCVVFAATLAAGCKEDLKSCPDCPITTVAMFDPTAGVIPLPNDLAKAATGRLPTTVELVQADGKKQVLATFPAPMKEFVDTYLNLAPGFPVEQPISIKFSCNLDLATNLCTNGIDPATLAGDAIRVYDVTDLRAALSVADATQRAAAVAAAKVTRVAGVAAGPAVQASTWFEDITQPPLTPAPPLPSTVTWLESAAKAPTSWAPGRTYYAVVTTAVKDTAGNPVSASQVFSYLKSKTPLVTATGAAAVFVSDNQTDADAMAAQLEPIRQSIAPFLDFFEASATDAIPRREVAVAWTFTTWPLQATLDAGSGVIPLPNDLVRTAPNGPIAIQTTKTLPDGAGGTKTVELFPAAQKAFIENYMNKLDGFPQEQSLSLPFDAPVDKASLAGGAVRVFDITAMLAEMAKAAPDLASVPLAEVTGLTYGANLLEYASASGLAVAQASVTPPSPWAAGHTYLAVATSALKGAGGAAVLPPFVFGFAKVSTKLVMDDGTPLIPASKEDAAQLEVLRSGMAPLLAWLAGLPGGQAIPTADVALAWTFTTSAGGEVLFDPTAGTLPFPNDLLMNPATGRVALPVSAGDPDAVKAIKGGLNTLDGFSNNGPATMGISLAPDPASVALIPDLGGILDLAAPIGVADITLVDPTDAATLTTLDVYGPDRMTARYDQGQLILQNVSGKPLPPNHRFAALVFDTLKPAEGTLPIHVSPVFWMARSELPLVDAQGRSQMPSILSDADAALLEQLRSAYGPFFSVLSDLGLKREKIIGFFTFTTGTTTADLQGLASMLPAPTKGSGSLKTVAEAGAPYAGLPNDGINMVCEGCTLNIRTVLAPPDLADPANPKPGHFQADAQGAPVLTPRPLPFELVVPKGPGPFPIVVVQHGNHGSRGDVARIANQLALAGLASFAVDLPMHGDHPIRIPGTPSGSAFFSANVFAVRDNMREGALDVVQAIRFIRDRDGGLVKQFTPLDVLLDTTKVSFLGTSLGAMEGTLVAGLLPDLPKVALVAPGGHMVRIFTETQNEAFRKPLLDALSALGITAGSPAFVQFLMLAQWALDRADPVNWAAVAKGATPADRFRIVEATGDEFMPNGTTEALALALGLAKGTTDAFRTVAAGTAPTDTICHGFFLWGCDPADFPALDQAKVAAAQADTQQWVIDFLKD